MQAIVGTVTQNPLVLMAESWLVRFVSVAGVAIFGDKVFTNSVAIDVTGVAVSGLSFAVNEALHYLKTNKKVTTAVAGQTAAVASDPQLAAALAHLQASLKTLENSIGGNTNV